MADLTLRLATEADVPFAQDAHHKGYHPTVVKQFGNWDEAQQDRFFITAWEAIPHHMLLIDGQVCGYVGHAELAEHWMVYELVVHPDFHLRGIGSAYLEQMKQHAAESQKPLRLQVLLQNTAQDFYFKSGFVEQGRNHKNIYLEWRPAA